MEAITQSKTNNKLFSENIAKGISIAKVSECSEKCSDLLGQLCEFLEDEYNLKCSLASYYDDKSRDCIDLIYKTEQGKNDVCLMNVFFVYERENVRCEFSCQHDTGVSLFGKEALMRGICEILKSRRFGIVLLECIKFNIAKK